EPAIEQTTAEQAPVLAASESPGDRIDATPPQSAGVQEVSAEQATVGLEADVPVGAEEDSSKIATTASKEPESPTSASSAAAEDNGEAEEGPETTAETSHAESPDSEDRSIDSPSAIESPQPIHDIEAVAPADSVETDAIADTAEIPHIELSPDTIGRVWTAALGSLGDMTADFAAHASSVAISAPNRLVVRFLGRYNTSKAYCERPEKRLAIEEAIQKVTGKQVRIEFSVTREDGPEKNPPAPAISPQQQMRQIASHPLVEMTVKLFDAQVLKIDPPKRRD
ncbi:MAG: hypothetical protein KDB27_35775, partial [Planctomycetales bacterium]|nr:hypothetical protein [Planctomycetales bacterium]